MVITEQPEIYIDQHGNKFWYLPSKGKRYWHRLDGPAAEYTNGTKEWWVDDKFHRLDGPAIEWAGGLKSWWIDGKELPTKKVEQWLKENNVDLKTEEGQVAFKLRWL